MTVVFLFFIHDQTLLVLLSVWVPYQLLVIFIHASFSGIVGEIEDGGDGNYIWTHKKFDIGYNGQYIVDVNLTSESKVKLKPGIKIPFSYEVILPSNIYFIV